MLFFQLLYLGVAVISTSTGKTATTCEWVTGGNGQLNMNCPAGTYIRVSSALYGRQDLSTCIPSGVDTSGFDLSCSSATAFSKVKQLCDEKTSCTVAASNGNFGDPCYGTWKYLTATYFCSTTCPTGWTPLATGCYRITQSTTFNNATALCKPEGHLVEINKRIEQDTLRTWYQDIRSWENERMWLGVTDSVTEGDWRWIQSGQSITFSNWYPLEPNNAGGNENCAVGESSQFKWQDIACSWNHRAICEYSESFIRVGDYENHLYDNGGKNNWHYVTITRVNEDTYKWTNKAGVSWNLYGMKKSNTLRVGEDCPYYNDGHREAVFNSDGVFGPGNEFYKFENYLFSLNK